LGHPVNLAILIPVYTFVLATYDGALGALMIVTLGSCVVFAVRSKWR
jgi:hypothetical protein